MTSIIQLKICMCNLYPSEVEGHGFTSGVFWREMEEQKLTVRNLRDNNAPFFQPIFTTDHMVVQGN
jgi:hypothetical protein